ncbi:MAG: hypothetical protein AB3N34_01575 [Lettuce witches'-broom phytoplasma]
MAAIEKQNKQNYLKTKNGKIFLGVVSAVVVILLVGLGVYFLMGNKPSKAIKKLEGFVDKFDEVVTQKRKDAIDDTKNDNDEKKTNALKPIVEELKKYLSDIEYLTQDKNAPKENDDKKTAFNKAKEVAKKIKTALDEADKVTAKDSAAVKALKDALDKITKDDFKTVVEESKKVYDIKDNK